MLETNGASTGWRIHTSSVAMGGARFQTTCGQQPVGHDSFLWSLADLMTLLLVFFIMLYSNATAQPLKGPEQVKEREHPGTTMVSDRVVGVFHERNTKIPVLDVEAGKAENMQPAAPVEKEPDTKPPEVPQADGNLSRQMLTDLEDRFSKDFYVRWEDRQPIIVLGERITFNAGEAILLFDVQDTLKRVAGLIRNLGDCQVVVTGHTDDRPYPYQRISFKLGVVSGSRRQCGQGADGQRGISWPVGYPGPVAIFNPLVAQHERRESTP